MFDRIRPQSRSWTLLAAVALVAFNAGCTSPSTPPSGAVVPVAAASGAAVPLPGFHAPELSSGWTDKPGWTSQH
ncbi:gamma-glutamyltransferase, partial [Burkholderia contaminans]